MSDEKNINSMIQDLIQLVQISDETIAFWASEALKQLTQLRALTSHLGFVQWSLANTYLFRDEPAVKPALKSALDALRKLADLLEDESIRMRADEESTGAASRIYGAVRSDATANTPGDRIET